jgi:hypothetical protein
VLFTEPAVNCKVSCIDHGANKSVDSSDNGEINKIPVVDPICHGEVDLFHHVHGKTRDEFQL